MGGTSPEQKKGTAHPTRKKAAPTNKARDYRIEKPHVPGHGSHPIRRILAERITSDGEKYFLLDWLPSWEKDKQKRSDEGRATSSYGVKTNLGRAWKEIKNHGYVYETRDDISISSSAPSDDDAEPMIRQMIESVAAKFREYLGIDSCKRSRKYNVKADTMAERLFPNADEWEFAKERDKKKAAKVAQRKKESEPSAVEVMRRTYIEMRNDVGRKSTAESDLQYGQIRVRFRGQVDKSLTPVTRHGKAMPEYYLAPLFSECFVELHPVSWDPPTMQYHINPLAEAVKALVQQSPYVLRSPWVMFFVRMFYDAARLEHFVFEVLDIKVEDGWDDRSRDEFLYTYKSEFAEWEHRSVDHIKTTYLRCREWIGDHMYQPGGTDKVPKKVTSKDADEMEDERISLEEEENNEGGEEAEEAEANEEHGRSEMEEASEEKGQSDMDED